MFEWECRGQLPTPPAAARGFTAVHYTFKGSPRFAPALAHAKSQTPGVATAIAPRTEAAPHTPATREAQTLSANTPSAGNTIIGGSRYLDREQANAECFALVLANLERRECQRIALDFLVHGVCLTPHRPTQLVCCEKIGAHGAIVDLEQLALVKPLPLPAGREFYGHCAFSADGATLYTTEVVRESGEGLIAVRDGESGEIEGEFPSYGLSPHECQLVDGGRTMVVTNGGGGANEDLPNVAYIDVASRALIKHEKPDNFRLNTGHFAIAEDESLVVVSAPRKGSPAGSNGGVSIQPQGKKLQAVSKPKKTVANMKGEALSVLTVGELAFVTHPDGDMLTVWSTANRSPIKRIDMPQPRGLALSVDKKHLVIAYGREASLIQLRLDTLELRPSTHFPMAFISGSHIANLAHLLSPA